MAIQPLHDAQSLCRDGIAHQTIAARFLAERDTER
jgi:hypothetical protein